ncbi:MAG TPA: CBS domain-containing protein [Syntrophales bacterium]|nr:CBS domain-containing protein [Syntrophales bacterium]
MLVRYWMSESPIVAQETTDLHDALNLMLKHDIRRLPVLSSENKLCGIITLSDLYPYVNPVSLKGQLSDAEIDNLKKHAVREIMATDLVTCGPNTPLEDVGVLLREKKLGALPVLKDDQLVGIITDCDVLEALCGIARAGERNVRICLSVPAGEKQNIIYDIVELCKRHRLDLQTVLVHPLRGSKRCLVMVRVEGPRTDAFVKALWDINYQVLIVSDGTDRGRARR